MFGSASYREMANTPPQVVQRVNELLFFDNLALYYLLERVPPRVFARAFLAADGRLAGALLGLMTPKQRETVHALMVQENDGDAEKNAQACDALVITANDMHARGFIRKKGPHYFGTPRTEELGGDPNAAMPAHN